MSKFTAACLAVLMLATWFTVGCSMGFHTEKSTGPVTVQKRLGSVEYQLLRSNGDLIVMDIDSRAAPELEVGESFSSIVYFDLTAYRRSFVKGEGYKPAPPKPPPTKQELAAKEKAEKDSAPDSCAAAAAQ